MHPTARILSVGDELVLGRVTDTNATFLCRLLTDQGFRVLGAQQVGDGLADLVSAMRHACSDVDLLVVSGGLGPTDDDRTRHALAEVMRAPLREHAPSWAAIRRRYAQVAPGKEIPPNNRRQALLPRGAKPLANDRGTAPGVLATVRAAERRTLVAVFPGVPHEMKAMAERLTERLPVHFPQLTKQAIGEIWFAGIGESAAQQRLGNLLTELDPQVGITVSEYGHLTIRVVGRSRAVAVRMRQVRVCLKGFLLPAAGLAPSLVAWLVRRKTLITTAESCTGGHVAALLTAIPRASQVLREGVIAYHPSVKAERLGVSSAIIAAGVVSQACARAMAVGALKQGSAGTSATIAVATTGIAGPTGGTADQPVGTVWLAVALKRGSVTRTATRKVLIQGTRERIQARAATAALQLVWDMLHGRIADDD